MVFVIRKQRGKESKIRKKDKKKNKQLKIKEWVYSLL
jgi:hypothetical protein